MVEQKCALLEELARRSKLNKGKKGLEFFQEKCKDCPNFGSLIHNNAGTRANAGNCEKGYRIVIVQGIVVILKVPSFNSGRE